MTKKYSNYIEYKLQTVLDERNYNKDSTIILAICGKSASGKDSLAHWVEVMLDKFGVPVWRVISDTTRPPRENEEEGKDYRYISKKKFEENINHGHYIEYTKSRGWYYGTPMDNIHFGRINIMVVNPEGLKNLAEYQARFTIVPIYLEVPFSTRMKRSTNREDGFQIEYLRRALTDFWDFRNMNGLLKQFRYDIIIPKENMNDVLGKTRTVIQFLQYHSFI